MSEDFDVNSDAAWAEAFDGNREEAVVETKAEQTETVGQDVGQETKEETVQDTVQVPDKSEQPEPMHKIKVGGEELERPLSEIIKRAQMGEDYTRKTQAVSEERKTIEAEKARIQQILQEIEASKIQQTQPQQPVQQFATETAQGESEESIFKARYGADFEFYDPDHQAKMRAIQRELAVKAAKDEIFKLVQQEKEQQIMVSWQQEMSELAQMANTEPKEVIDFASQAIGSTAQTDPDRFIVLWTASKKIANGQANSLTAMEARALKEHLIASRKAYYESKTKKPDVKEMKTETSAPPVKVSKTVDAEAIRRMDSDDVEKLMNEYFKGG